MWIRAVLSSAAEAVEPVARGKFARRMANASHPARVRPIASINSAGPMAAADPAARVVRIKVAPLISRAWTFKPVSKPVWGKTADPTVAVGIAVFAMRTRVAISITNAFKRAGVRPIARANSAGRTVVVGRAVRVTPGKVASSMGLAWAAAVAPPIATAKIAVGMAAAVPAVAVLRASHATFSSNALEPADARRPALEKSVVRMGAGGSVASARLG